MKLLERIAHFNEMTEGKPTDVFMGNISTGIHPDSYSELGRINRAFKIASEQEKISLARAVLDCWLNSGQPGYEGDRAEQVFGVAYEEFKDEPVTATLTGNHNQLRVWVSQPGVVKPVHCDSCGSPYIMQVSKGSCIEGDPTNRISDEYVGMLAELIAEPVVLPNRGMVFARDERNRAKMWSSEWGDRYDIRFPDRGE